MKIEIKKKQKQSIIEIILMLIGLGLAGFCLLKAYAESIDLYKTPSQAHSMPEKKIFRIGGIVTEGSLLKTGNNISFLLEDGCGQVNVYFEGLAPRLLQEQKEAIVVGHMENNIFYAKEVLAKHDESYQPQKKSVSCPV
ncbi:MAG: cytochrome c maturation protein CcmE [Gammaproteobacteria bacterium]|nr:cytochrome c maturation protein CcmE [Gammaproteobacteria bacterium]